MDAFVRLAVECLEAREMLDANGIWVRDLYVMYLGRVPAADEVSGWRRLLDQGHSQEALWGRFRDSQEFREHRVHLHYGRLLGRTPEPQALAAWSHPTATGWDEQSVQRGVLESDEFFTRHGATDAAWLTAVYRAVLRRTPDKGGFAAWQEHLRAGSSRAGIAAAILHSPEAKDLRGDARRPVVYLDAATLATARPGNGGPGIQSDGDGPALIIRQSGVYVLEDDLHATGTGIFIAAPNVTVDLNGHTVYYNERPHPEVLNGGFESSCSDGMIPDWIYTGTAVFSCPAARVGMWGQQMLRLSEIPLGKPHHLISAPIALPLAERGYSATITPKCDGLYAQCLGLQVQLQVFDAVTEKPLTLPTSAPNTEHGYSAVIEFTPETVNPVELHVTITSQSWDQAQVDLDYAAVFPSRDYGIVAAQVGDESYPRQLRGILGTGRVHGLQVRNGRIEQGEGRSRTGNPLWVQDTSDLRVVGVAAHATGMDTSNLNANTVANTRVENSTFTADIDLLTKRTDQRAARSSTDAAATYSSRATPFATRPNRAFNCETT